MYLKGIRFLTRFSCAHLLMLLAVFVARNNLDAQCVHFFDDEAVFLASTVNPDMESFEGLPVTNDFTANTQFILPGFTLDLEGTGGVYNTPTAGMFATHGSNYINYQAPGVSPSNVTWTFSSPKNAFGLNIVDWGDFGSGELTFMSNAGDSYTVDVAPNPNGSQQFFGVINYDFAFDMVVFTQTIVGEAYGIDEVYCEFINIPATTGLACKNTNVSLNEDCEILITPQTVLSGFYPCYDKFVVELSYHNSPINNPITLDYIGKEVTASVMDTTTGNRCWSTILVEDKFSPEVICVDDTVNCIEFKYYYDTPLVVEHCLQDTLLKIDEYVESLSCDSNYIKKVTQTFIAKDAYGNVSDTCSRTIWIERFDLENINCPERQVELYCSDIYKTDQYGYPHPSVTGSPKLDTLDLYPQPDFFCNLWVEYTDVDLGKIGCTRRIQRNWTVQEWFCTGDLEERCTQIIYIKDTLGPDLRFPVDSIYATTNPGYHNCDGDVYIPVPYVKDICHDEDRLDLRYPGGFVDDWQGERIKLPVGFHTVYVRAYDSCYNWSDDSIVVHMQDKTAPIAVCDQNTVVALDNDGVVHVYAEVFDDGSFDDCHIKKMEVRRMNDDPCFSGTDVWGDYVEFCCADVNQEVMVGFRVADKNGNYGTCMVTVLVTDKLPPRVVCPPDITVDCRFDWDPNHLEVFGTIVSADSLRQPIVIDSDTVRFSGPALDGVGYDNCPMNMLDSMSYDVIDNCGNGILRRYFMGVDAQGQRSLYCTQTITLLNANPFDSTDIIWPEDFDTVNVCASFFFNPDDLSEERARPRYNNEDECSLVGATYKDHVIDITGGAEGCFKILRKWKVIDWCQFDHNEFMKWEHDQIIIVENTNAPVIIQRNCVDTVFCFYTANCTPPPFTLTANALDDCTFRDDLFWKAKFDYDNNGSFDTIRQGSNIITDVFPVGVHRIKWFVEDLCGNETTCEHIFEIRNCKAPFAYCRTGAILELVPMDLDGDGNPDAEMAELWASDLDDGSTAGCNNDVTFSFTADTTDKVRWYDCDSIGNRGVTIWVTNRTTGISSRCITMVTIQDNNNVNICPQTANGNIVGQITTRDQDHLVGTTVQLDGSGMPEVTSDQEGEYAFMDMPFGGQYELIPTKDDDVLNGVTTADIVKIQRHLLGKTDLDDAYQHIAADVNLSGSISAADISEIRKVILGNRTDFSSDKSWRFMEENYQFLDPNDPLVEAWKESMMFDPFDKDATIDWLGVKLGDVDGSADPTGLDGGISTRSSYSLTVTNEFLGKGEEAEIIISNTQLEAFDACQFTLEIDADQVELLDIIPLNADIDYSHFNMGMKHLGIVTFSWDNAELHPVDELFAVRVRTKSDAFISDMMALTSEITLSALSYQGDERPVKLEFKDVVKDNLSIELYQNVPNPWSDQTIIRFQLPTSQYGSLSVLDANGRLLWTQEGQMSKGMNNITIDKDVLPVGGVLYYQLKTDDHVQTRKMLLL